VLKNRKLLVVPQTRAILCRLASSPELFWVGQHQAILENAGSIILRNTVNLFSGIGEAFLPWYYPRISVV
jgi:hypothetical protein